ncbi:hypothetical protein OFC47_25465 [Escherichia coli]|nr:hypothetical protein [Escherichia coli]
MTGGQQAVGSRVVFKDADDLGALPIVQESASFSCITVAEGNANSIHAWKSATVA